MKKFILTIFVVVVLAAIPAYGALTNTIDVDAGQITSYWWTGEPYMDKAWLWSKEVEDILEGTSGLSSLFFTPTDTPPTTNEGQLYYNDTANLLKLYNGSAWVNISISTGVSLDGAYDLGNSITVDGTAVTLNVADGDNNSALAIVSAAATNDIDAVTITTSTAGYVGDSLYINGVTGSTDIRGDNWNMSQAGLLTIAGGITINTGGELLVSARDVLFDDTYDVAWDTSRDMLIFQDNAVLGLGGAHDAVADVTIKWNASNLLIESATEDTGEWQFGATNAIDVVHYANTNTSTAKFNASTATLELNGYDFQLLDDDIVAYGDSDEFQTYYDETTTDNLITVATNANDAVQIGDGTTNTDLKMMGATASTFANWDASADEMVFDLADLKISQGSQIEFIDVTDSGTDWTIDNATDETLLIYPTETTDDQSINLGNATNTTDLRIFGATASTVVYDASADAVLYDAYDIALGDGDSLLLGDTLGTGDFSITDTSDVLVFGQVAAGTGAAAFGVDDAGMDVTFYGDTASQKDWWDASGDEWFHGADAEGVDHTWYGDITAKYMKWDEDAATNGQLLLEGVGLALGDGDAILFGDTLGTGDFSISDISDVLTIDVVSAGVGSIAIGNDADDVPLKWFGETASSYFQFTGDTFVVAASNILLDATSELYDKLLAGTKVLSGIPVVIEFRPTGAETLTYTVPTGYTLVVTDCTGWKIAAAGSGAGDDLNLQNNDGSAANIFDTEELDSVADKARITFDNLDDAENEVASTNTLDLVAAEASSCDSIIVVTGYLK